MERGAVVCSPRNVSFVKKILEECGGCGGGGSFLREREPRVTSYRGGDPSQGGDDDDGDDEEREEELRVADLRPRQRGEEAKKAIHLSPVGVAGMKFRSEELPEELRRMLADGGDAFFVEGVRVRSDVCRMGPLPWATASDENAPWRQGGKYRMLDLFAGIGGFHVGWRNALAKAGTGMEDELTCVGASEIDSEAVSTYVANHGVEIPMLGDIVELDACDVPSHNVLCAGFPCQSFSNAGTRRGFGDHRGQLFFEVVRIAKYHKPAVLLLENVANLARHDEGQTLERIVDELEGIGYAVQHRILNARYFGVPQKRERIYFVCFRDKEVADAFQWPEVEEQKIVLNDVLSSEPPTEQEHYLTPPQVEQISRRGEDRKAPHLDDDSDVNIDDSPEQDRDTVIPYWRVARRNSVARTLISSYRRSFLSYSEFVTEPDGRVRFYTPRECARIMGFDDSFRIDAVRNPSRFIHQAGNAVCPPVVEALVRSILHAPVTW